MEAGASDYLAKGEFTAPILERSIRYSIMSKHIEEELKQHRSNLEELVRKRTIQHAEARADAERRAHEAEGRQAILRSSARTHSGGHRPCQFPGSRCRRSAGTLST